MAKPNTTDLSTGELIAVSTTSLAGLALLVGIALNTPTSTQDPVQTESDLIQSAASERKPEAYWSAEFAIDTPRRVIREAVLGRGETLSDLLIGQGVSPTDAHRALAPLFDADHIDPRRLRPGLRTQITLEESSDDSARLVGLNLRTAADHSFVVTTSDNGEFVGTRLDARLSPQPLRISGEVSSSLYEAALAQGAGDQQVVDFAKIFAYDVDFQREIHPGDRFEIVYESLVDERGNPVQLGNVIYAALDGRALDRSFYFFTPSDDGATDYFDSNGESATKFLMKTPINGARLSSHFGNRRHPISGYTRLHKGTDFAAPTGTPVYAAGHGTVERASRYGGYGHYVRIRHANGYKTAYAHLSRYGAGIRSGRSVRQGDIIGYVGSTGASTGPHLHYEVMINGRHVNAMQLNFPTGRKLAESPDMLDEFLLHKQAIDAVRRDLGAEIDVAETIAAQDAG